MEYIVIGVITIEAFYLIGLATDFAYIRKLNDINDFIDDTLERRAERRREKRRKQLEKESDKLCEREGYKRKEVNYASDTRKRQ